MLSSIRPADPLDFFRCQTFGGPKGSNRAYTLKDTAGRGKWPAPVELARATVSPPRRVAAWVSTTGPRIHAMSVARQRSGPQSWEVTHLFSGSGGQDGEVSRLLEGVAGSAASYGGERVFLRLRAEDPLIGEAQRGGFFPSVSETLFESGPVPWRHRRRTDAMLRKMERSDEYDAFRLYNSSTPAEIRRSTAVTFDQWRACLEHRRGMWRRFAVTSETTLTGWIAVHRGPMTGWMSAVASPDPEGRLASSSMIDFALSRLRGVRRVYCLVPYFQPEVRTALLERGFISGPEYTILVKANASVVRETAGAEVGVGTA